MNIVICDDDLSSRLITKINIERWATERSEKAEIALFDNGDALLDHLEKAKTDIIFLDIMMPLLTGMETARIIRSRSIDVKLVFLTSSPEFAIESYDVNASGYLLKPIVYEKLAKLLDKAKSELAKAPSRFPVKTALGYQSIDPKKLECMEAQGKKVTFHMSDGTSVDASGTFSSYGKMLSGEQGFFKCHRSYIIGLSHVKSFTASEVTTYSGMVFPIARGLGQAFKDAYCIFMQYLSLNKK